MADPSSPWTMSVKYSVGRYKSNRAASWTPFQRRKRMAEVQQYLFAVFPLSQVAAGKCPEKHKAHRLTNWTEEDSEVHSH